MVKRKKSLKKPALQAQFGVFTPSASVLGVPVGAALIAVAVFIVYLPCATGEEAGILARVQGQTALAK